MTEVPSDGMTLASFRDRVIGYVADEGERLGPDEDWSTEMLMSLPDDKMSLVMVDPGMPGPLLGPVLAGIVRSENPMSIAFVASAWTVLGSLAEEGVLPADSPHRVEIVMVAMIDHEGMTLSQAEVKRGGPHPTLGEWDHYAQGEFDGAIASPLQEAMRAAVGGGGS